MPCDKDLYNIDCSILINKEVRDSKNEFIGRINQVIKTRPVYNRFEGICEPGQILVINGNIGKWISGYGYIADDNLILTNYHINDEYVRPRPRQAWS